MPPLSQYFPRLQDFTDSQRRFYKYWKKRWQRGQPVDVEGNVSYLFAYCFEVLNWQDNIRRVEELEALLKAYPSENIANHIPSWISDCYLEAGDFASALEKAPLPQLGRTSRALTDRRLSLKLLINKPINSKDVLACFYSKLTRFGREKVSLIAEQIDILLDEWERENEKSYICYVADKVPQKERYPIYLFIGVPFERVFVAEETKNQCNHSDMKPFMAIPFSSIEEFQRFGQDLVRAAENAVRDEMGLRPVQKQKERRPRKVAPPPVARGAVTKEDLPFPVVYYPNPYGSFFAFAEAESSPATLCACSISAIENLLELNKIGPARRNMNPLRNAMLSSSHFPDFIAELSLKSEDDPMSSLRFEESLCHRCNLVKPTLRYCHEMYGSQFMQYYGWYVKQAYFRLGINPSPFGDYRWLPNVCPQEYQEDMQALMAAKMEYMSELERVMKIVRGPHREDIAPSEITYWQNVRIEEAEPVIELQRKAGQAERAFTKKIENLVRKEFGFRGVGEGWVSETMLYNIVRGIFPNEEVVFHYHPNFLEGLELDIYLPGRKLAFEYQGQQHFHPVKAWGGEKALQELKARDARKARICREKGVKLLTVDYTEPLTEAHICDILSET